MESQVSNTFPLAGFVADALFRTYDGHLFRAYNGDDDKRC